MRGSDIRQAGAVLLSAALLAGCVGPVQRSLHDGKLDKIDVARRDLHLADIEVVDARAPEELLPLTPELRYLVPLVIWNQWATEGHLRPDAHLYSPDLTGEMKAVFKTAFEKSGLVATNRDGAGLRLKVKINHLYGITHSSQDAFVAMGAASNAVRTFAAYGYAEAQLELSDASGKLIGTRQIVGAFDPDFKDIVGAGAQLAPKNPTDELALAAVSAAAKLASNAVRAVEPMVAGFPQPSPMPVDKMTTFFLARPAEEGPFLEIAGVNIETGEILSDVVVPRWMEPYAAANEWVVDPYHGGQVRLTPDEYERLIDRLDRRYDVRFTTDVRTAHFFGIKRAGASDKRAKEPPSKAPASKAPPPKPAPAKAAASAPKPECVADRDCGANRWCSAAGACQSGKPGAAPVPKPPPPPPKPECVADGDCGANRWCSAAGTCKSGKPTLGGH